MPPKFVHLHVHSHFSLLDGLSKVQDLITKAQSLDMPAVALTDHGVMYGSMEFYLKAKKAGIKPIIGVEAYVARNGHTNKRPGVDTRPYHFVLLAKNEEGYRNLVKLTSYAHLDGFYYKPRIDHELLRKHSAGLIGLSACLAGELAQNILNKNDDGALAAVKQYQDILGKENFYLEVQHHAHIPEQGIVNDQILKLASHLGVQTVATVDSHYLNEDDNVAQDALVCIQTKKTMSDADRLSMIEEDFSFASAEKVAADWKDHPEVLETSLEIAEKCNINLRVGEPVLPHFEVPDKHTPDSYLEELCKKGMIKRYGTHDVSDEIKTRVAYELGIIKKTGFASYFLITADFINWAKDNKIVVGPGRGSAAGSLVSYLIGITNIDPIKYNLIFERFLNPDRISMPDIDTDFADTRRDEVIKYVADKYGHDHVAQIITFGTMAARAAIRDTGRVLGLPYAYCDKVSKMIPMFTSLDKALETIPELQAIMNEPDGKRLIEIAKRLEGCARHASTHACGVVVAPQPLTEYLPLQRSTQNEEDVVTQYDGKMIEEIGLLKIDFLGLKNLTIIENTLDILKKARGIEIDIDSLPLDDAKTFELFQRADTTGVFQLESAGMKRYLKQLKPTELEDIIAMCALYRPGPMELIPDYIAGKHGTKDITYLHPKLKPILQNTYGIGVYQEQMMQIARDLAGFTMAEGDILRKAIGKKIQQLLDEQRLKLIDGMVRNGIDQQTAEAIWELFPPFARYGFNRSHAACYAMIAYQTAYLKAHYPAEFMASLLTADHGNIDRIAIEVDACRHMNLEVLPPDINESFSTFTVVYDSLEVRTDKESNKIRFGLQAVKNLGNNIIKELIKERKEHGRFETLEDLLTRVKTKDLNKKSIEAMIKCGALDGLGERNQLLYNIDTILTYVKNHNEELSSKQSSLFGLMATEASLPQLQLAAAPSATDKQKLQWEKEYLGLYVSAHPVQEYIDTVRGDIMLLNEVQEKVGCDESMVITTIGVLQSIKKIITRAGKSMAFAKMEDVTSAMEVVIFPTILELQPDLWQEDAVVLMNCRVSDKDGELKLVCNQARKIDSVASARLMLSELKQLKGTNPTLKKFGNASYKKSQQGDTAHSAELLVKGTVYIQIPEKLSAQTVHELKEILKNYTGKYKACLYVTSSAGVKKVQTSFMIDTGLEIKQKVEALLGPNTFLMQV